MRLKRPALLLAMLMVAGCQRGIDLPPALEGTYVTSDSTYADRSFTLTPEHFVVHLGEVHGSVDYRVRRVHRDDRPGREGDLYTVVYLNDALEYKLTFYASPTTPDEIVFKNQSNVKWTRQAVLP